MIPNSSKICTQSLTDSFKLPLAIYSFASFARFIFASFADSPSRTSRSKALLQGLLGPKLKARSSQLLRSRLLGRAHGHDRRTADIQFQVIRRHPQSDRVFLHGENRSLQPSAGHNLIPSLQFRQHLLPFLLPSLLGKDQKEVNNPENQQNRSKQCQSAPAA